MRDPKHLDDTRLLPRYRPIPTIPLGDRLEVARARAAFTATTTPATSSWNRADQLRGIPVVGGCAGVSPGTDPLRETIRRDEQRHRRGQLPTARFGRTIDEAAASILASLRTPPVPHNGEDDA